MRTLIIILVVLLAGCSVYTPDLVAVPPCGARENAGVWTDGPMCPERLIGTVLVSRSTPASRVKTIEQSAWAWSYMTGGRVSLTLMFDDSGLLGPETDPPMTEQAHVERELGRYFGLGDGSGRDVMAQTLDPYSYITAEDVKHFDRLYTAAR